MVLRRHKLIKLAPYWFKDDNLDNAPNIQNPATLECEYDANGNLVKDINKDITDIDYNHLNLPEQISISDKGRIEYLYDAAGIKLRQKVFPTNASLEETNYIGNFVYEGESSLKHPQKDDWYIKIIVVLWFIVIYCF